MSSSVSAVACSRACDSRVYLARAGELAQLSRDHVDEQQRHVLCRAIGLGEEVEAHSFETQLHDADIQPVEAVTFDDGDGERRDELDRSKAGQRFLVEGVVDLARELAQRALWRPFARAGCVIPTSASTMRREASAPPRAAPAPSASTAITVSPLTSAAQASPDSAESVRARLCVETCTFISAPGRDRPRSCASGFSPRTARQSKGSTARRR